MISNPHETPDAAALAKRRASASVAKVLLYGAGLTVLSYLGAGVAATAGAPWLAAVLAWPSLLLSNLIPQQCFGPPALRECEATLLHVAASLAGIPLCWAAYSALIYALLRRSRPASA